MNSKQPKLSNFIVLLSGQIDSAEVSSFNTSFNLKYYIITTCFSRF